MTQSDPQDNLEDILIDASDICRKIVGLDLKGGYERVVNAISELIVAVELARIGDSVPGGAAHDLSTARAFRILRKMGMASKEAEIRSGFGSAEDSLAVRDLAPEEDVVLPVIRVEAPVDEQAEAKAFTILMRWLSSGGRPFWKGVINGCHVQVETRPSDPTIIQVGWYNDKGVLQSHIDFDLRFRRRRYLI